MTTALVESQQMTALSTRQDMGREQVELLKRTICQGATDDELALFVQATKRLGLDPFARQVFAVKRWDSNQKREVMSIQVSIDGFRLVAERTGKYAGQLGPFWTRDGKEWVDVWLDSKPPAAAKVGILRHDFKEPVWAVATWEQYKQTKRDGSLSSMWQKFGPLMLAKCCESLGLRRAFPNELSDAYSPEEMAQATTVEVIPPQAKEGSGPKVSGAGATSTVAQTSSGPAQTASSTTKRPKAPQIKHNGVFATHKQVAYLHALKTKAGLKECKGDCATVIQETPKWGQPPRDKTLRCPYHTQLAAFRDCDDRQITTSKDLSEEQISNLIERYEEKLAKHETRVADVPDLGPVAARPDDSHLTEVRRELEAKGDERLLEELCEVFRIPTLDMLPEA